MATRLRTPLSTLTTLAVGGPAEVTTLDDVVHLRDVVSTQPGGDQPPVCLGWGSNVLASDSPINVPVILVRTQGITVTSGPEPDQVNVTLQAGHSLIDLVEFAATEGLLGVETLAGVPGTVGAMPIQNVGAYGQETADTLNKLTAWDWHEAREVTFSAADCQFGHRTSRFKRSHHWMILTVTFTLTRSRRSAPIIYAELARHLEGPLRVGASWLIRQAGYELGQNLAPGVRISNRHFTLVTDDGAAAANFAVSAKAIRDRVHRSTGVDLDFEPDLIGHEAVFDALVDPVHR